MGVCVPWPGTVSELKQRMQIRTQNYWTSNRWTDQYIFIYNLERHGGPFSVHFGLLPIFVC